MPFLGALPVCRWTFTGFSGTERVEICKTRFVEVNLNHRKACYLFGVGALKSSINIL